jgi:hypothetical protein
MTDQEGQTPPREASEPVSRAEFEALRERVAELEAQVGPSGDILRAVTGAASLHRGTPAWYRSVSGLTLPRSAGRGSTLARERPVALSRGLPSASESSPRGFSPRLSPKRSCGSRERSSLVITKGRRPFERPRGTSTGAVHTFSGAPHHPGFPRTANMGGVRPDSRRIQRRESAEPVCELSTRPILSVGVPDRPPPVVCDTTLTRFTPALKGGILSLNQDSPATGSRAGRRRREL